MIYMAILINHVNPVKAILHCGAGAGASLLHVTLTHEEIIDSIQVLAVEETDLHFPPAVSR